MCHAQIVPPKSGAPRPHTPRANTLPLSLTTLNSLNHTTQDVGALDRAISDVARLARLATQLNGSSPDTAPPPRWPLTDANALAAALLAQRPLTVAPLAVPPLPLGLLPAQCAPASTTTKRCVACRLHLPTDSFHVRRAAPDGREARCRSCLGAAAAARAAARLTAAVALALDVHARPPPPPTVAKQCTNCGVMQPMSNFHRHAGRTGGRSCRCVICARAATAAVAAAAATAARPPPTSTRACRRCRVTKPATEFATSLRARDGLSASCRACAAAAAAARSARAPPPCKTCRRCGDTKDAAEFYRCPLTRDGLQSHCAECMRAARRRRVG